MAGCKRVRELLTPGERQKNQSIPEDISDWVLGTHFTLTSSDISLVNQHRRGYNRLGFAVQLCVLRYTGWTMSETEEVPHKVFEYVGSQIGVAAEEFQSYGVREATKWEHMQEIRNMYRYSIFEGPSYRRLMRHLEPYAMANSNASYLIPIALETLKGWKYVLPAMGTNALSGSAVTGPTIRFIKELPVLLLQNRRTG